MVLRASDVHKTVVAVSPAARSREVAATLLREIIDGRFVPGQRLPTRVELERRFDSCPATINKAFTQLIRRGFVVARRRIGTVVAERPPHLAHYALVFPNNPDDTPTGGWKRLMESFRREALRRDATGPLSFPSYFNITGHSDVEQYAQLLRLGAERSVAGMICVTPPYWLDTLPEQERPRVPIVGFMNGPRAGVPAVSTDMLSWVDRALDVARQQGCRRVAAITVPPASHDVAPWHAHIRQCAATRGIDVRDQWLIPAHHQLPETARYVTRLLLSAERGERPEALLVFDDHLVEEATRGVCDAGLANDRELLVIAHANYPDVPATHVPVTYLGFSVPEILQACVDVVDMQRRGDPHPVSTRIPARLASELPPLAVFSTNSPTETMTP